MPFTQSFDRLLVHLFSKPYLVVRKKDESKSDSKNTFFKFEKISPELVHDTPLWFYILAEAQASIFDALQSKPESDGTFNEDELLKKDVAQTQLGGVGGRIVAEVFYGLIDSDEESYVNQAPSGWKPIWAHDLTIGHEVIFANLLKFAGQPISHH